MTENLPAVPGPDTSIISKMNRQKKYRAPVCDAGFSSDFKQQQADYPWPIAGRRFPRLSA
ncbi:MAG: hypothetical protein LC662_11360 [Rhodothermaceae bacterium]|nr:hypothetical protein [Rhodothermaceae bacterium]